jgi:hypothetical protein
MFEAAPQTAIAAIEYARSFDIAWEIQDGLYGRPYVVDVWHDSEEMANQIESRLGPWSESLADDAVVRAAGGRWQWLTLRLSCSWTIGTELCSPFRASLVIPRVTLKIADEYAPTGWAQVEAFDSVVRGRTTVGVVAGDVGGGVYRVVVSVDGREVAREVLDADGGRCRDAEPSNDDPYEFAAPRPCPLDVTGSVALDTRGLRDGAHQLRVVAEDAAGNTSLLHDSVVTTHNAPIATVPPAVGGTANVGERLTVAPGTWDGAPTAVAHRWLRCDAAGEACAAIAGASGDAYTVVETDVGARLAVEAVAENQAGSGTARSVPTPIVQAATQPTGGTGGRGGDEPPSTPAGGGPSGGTPSGAGAAIPNPVAGQGGHAPNGDGATGQARLTLRLRLAGGGTAVRASGRSSRRWSVTGRLTDGSGRAVADARVNLVTRVAGRRWKADRIVRTGEDGRFSTTLSGGPSRTVRATYYPFADSRSYRSSNTVSIETFAPLTLRVDRARIGGGGTVTLVGRAGGGSIPAGGLLVTLQGHQRGWGWRTFRTVRTTRTGSWRTRYRFRSPHGRFAFRAIVPRQARYPFATTTSGAVAVHVG